jgi:hypothetical protein
MSGPRSKNSTPRAWGRQGFGARSPAKGWLIVAEAAKTATPANEMRSVWSWSPARRRPGEAFRQDRGEFTLQKEPMATCPGPLPRLNRPQTRATEDTGTGVPRPPPADPDSGGRAEAVKLSPRSFQLRRVRPRQDRAIDFAFVIAIQCLSLSRRRMLHESRRVSRSRAMSVPPPRNPSRSQPRLVLNIHC